MRLRLSSWLNMLRDALSEAVTERAAASGDGPDFIVEEVELEACIETATETSATGSVTVWVIDASAERSASTTKHSTVRIRMRPHAPIRLGANDTSRVQHAPPRTN